MAHKYNDVILAWLDGKTVQQYNRKTSSADILWLIEQLEWLSVEQKKISMKELLSLFKESVNV